MHEIIEELQSRSKNRIGKWFFIMLSKNVPYLKLVNLFMLLVN